MQSNSTIGLLINTTNTPNTFYGLRTVANSLDVAISVANPAATLTDPGLFSVAGNGAVNIRTSAIALTNPFSITDEVTNTDVFLVKGDGSVGIGTTAVSGAKLSVEGIIRARRVLVNNTWADYVFETNYQLMPLTDLETYITTKKHLPNVPTAQDIEKDGVDLGKINKILVEKVEELTLYIISMNKRMVQLEAEMKQSKQK